MSDLPDPLSARLVLTVGMLANTLECFDDLGIEARGDARRHAEGILKIMGPAAVFTAILQAAPALAASDRVAGFVDVFVGAATRRRIDLLAALAVDERERVLAHEAGRSVAPERVVQMFSQAVAGSSLGTLVERIGGGRDLAAMDARLARARGELARTGDPTDLGPSLAQASEALASFPAEALRALGGALAGQGVDETALAQVLDGVLPPETPQGFVHDGAGTLRRAEDKLGRNAPCPCGSGRKVKKCHGLKGV